MTRLVFANGLKLHLSHRHFVPVCPIKGKECEYYEHTHKYSKDVKVDDYVFFYRDERFVLAKVLHFFLDTPVNTRIHHRVRSGVWCDMLHAMVCNVWCTVTTGSPDIVTCVYDNTFRQRKLQVLSRGVSSTHIPSAERLS